MSSILTGIFTSNSDYKRLENELETAGFDSNTYIVYLEDGNNHSQYMASVETNNELQIDTVKNIFNLNSVLKTFTFQNMSISEAKYEDLKKHISVTCKSEIHSSPNLKKKILHTGIDSEVKA